MQDSEILSLNVGEIWSLSESEHVKKVYSCRFVRAGSIKAAGGVDSDIEITQEALRFAVERGLFNERACFVDHAGCFESPSLKDLAGVTFNARWNELTQSIDGEIKLYETEAGSLVDAVLRELLDESLGSAPDVGLSIVFWPEWEKAEGKGKKRINGIRHVESVDFVFQPAAGGRVLAKLSAISNRLTEIGGVEVSEESKVKELEGAPGEENVQLGVESVGGWQEAIAEVGAAALISASGLPEASKERMKGKKYGTPEEVKAAISAEWDFLGKLNEDKVISIGGQAPRGVHISMGRTSLEQIEEAFEALIMGTRPKYGIQPLTGIRELYNLLSGDYDLTGVFQPERVQFASVTSSTMSNLCANVLNKVIMAEFINYPQWWKPIVNEVDFTTLQAVRWITLGGVGELPTVAEGAAYTELTWDDKYETSSFVKKGGYLGITIEAIDKDDTGRIRSAPRALAQAAWLTMGKAISNIFTQSAGVGPTLIDTGALFNSTAVTTAGGHANLGTTALSMTTWSAARLAMRKQVEEHSGERLGALTAPKYLLVPPDLEVTALQVLGSDRDYTYALANAPGPSPVNIHTEGSLDMMLKIARERVIVMDLWTDTNDWAAVADPKLYPTIGVGYRYGRVPEIFSVASPTAGLMFSNDTMPIKVRFFFAAGPVDYRGLYKANVA